MSIAQQLEILRTTKISLHESIESIGESLNNKTFGQYSNAVDNFGLFLDNIDDSLTGIIDSLDSIIDDINDLDDYFIEENEDLTEIELVIGGLNDSITTLNGGLADLREVLLSQDMEFIDVDKMLDSVIYDSNDVIASLISLYNYFTGLNSDLSGITDSLDGVINNLQSILSNLTSLNSYIENVSNQLQDVLGPINS